MATMATEVPTTTTEPTVEKKRRKRSQSQYITLLHCSSSTVETRDHWKAVGGGNSPGACLKQIETDKITGRLMIVCKRLVVDVSAVEVVKIVPAKGEKP